jgi:hypothetical protein
MTTADGLLMPAVIVWTKEPALVSSVSELEVWGTVSLLYR